jgi:hypothetical protein
MGGKLRFGSFLVMNQPAGSVEPLQTPSPFQPVDVMGIAALHPSYGLVSKPQAKAKRQLLQWAKLLKTPARSAP